MAICRLCHNKDVALKDSHIISKMFYNAIKKKSPTGIMRQTNDPNKGVQDGLKVPFLCEKCEELFSKYETFFSNHIYSKAIQKDGDFEFESSDNRIAYFLLSIAWRSIAYTIENDEMTFSKKEKERVSKTIETWRGWLLSENMQEIRKIQQFIIPTKKLLIFQGMERRIRDNVMLDLKTFDEENTFKFAFSITQVPYFIFITTVWGETQAMKQYCLGRKIKAYSSRLPKQIENVLLEAHQTNFAKANEQLSDKQRQIIMERVKKKM